VLCVALRRLQRLAYLRFSGEPVNRYFLLVRTTDRLLVVGELAWELTIPGVTCLTEEQVLAAEDGADALMRWRLGDSVLN
jgi:hypothetical protein